MNGKGDRPRNNHSATFRDNFDAIKWKDWDHLELPKPGCYVTKDFGAVRSHVITIDKSKRLPAMTLRGKR